ncbi:MAG: hypothetical protein RLZZ338_3759 [Cyanobacteriota bacterium]|jgi:choline dehydrogenase-like flavoprotein
MSPNQKINASFVNSDTVSKTVYDVVIVGSGVAGAIVAKELSQQGKKVLIIEATAPKGLTLESFQSYVDAFYGSVDKDDNSPYPKNPNALSPTHYNDYFVEKGPMPLAGSYSRVMGGTTLHWEGKTPRMVPNDFKLKTEYGQGRDWPIKYEEIIPYYNKAEYEMGVSGDVEDQKAQGIKFIPADYVFPMEKMPASFLDQKVIEKVEGTEVQLYDKTYKLEFSSFPQARNGVPNPKYDAGNLFVPDGVTGLNPVQYGERCQGNSNCVPICPVQAKYDARRSLTKALQTGHVHIISQAVACRIEFEPQKGRVTAIHYKRYEDPHSPKHTLETAKGELFVLASGAIENAKLMLASDLPNKSTMIGRNLMDHPFTLAWALMPEVTGTMRGPLVTSGIGTFRDGKFRKKQSAFAVDIHNDGWGWATGSPSTNEVIDAVDKKNKYGAELRQTLISRISRQLLLAFMCELPPEPSNRVTIDPKYKDQLGNYRPVINFNLPDYTIRTLAYTRKLSRLIFQRLGAEDYTEYSPQDDAYFEFEGEGYFYRGGNHFSGTHIMGTLSSNSVVNENLRCWDHENLYALGSGSMPSIGSSNTTLTIAALSFKAAEHMLKKLATKN